jgi:phosphoglycerol transferase MdoB-like AlkP superfamily enzyme
MASRELCALKMTVRDIRDILEEIVGELSWSNLVYLLKIGVWIVVVLAIILVPACFLLIFVSHISFELAFILTALYVFILFIVGSIYAVNYEDCKNDD